MIFCFDLDGTLCRTVAGNYPKAEPYNGRIRTVNQLHKQGHRIIISTARGAETGMDWEPLTKEQLTRWGVQHDALYVGKPFADVYVDDRAQSDKTFFKGRR